MAVSQSCIDLIRSFGGGEIVSNDLETYEEKVTELIDVPLNRYQIDALVSFAECRGLSILSESSLLRRLNAQEDPCSVAKEELPKWNYGKDRVLQTLSRRRSAELELFCHAPPERKWGWLSIKSKCPTWLKKEPKKHSELGIEEKAKIYPSRKIRRCRVIRSKNNHTLLDMVGLGEWWVLDKDWYGLCTEACIKKYGIDEDLIYLREFPYFHKDENEEDENLTSHIYAMSMCLKYLDNPSVNTPMDYLSVVSKYGQSLSREANGMALEELGMKAKFTYSADPQDIREIIDTGLPVVASLLPRGSLTRPFGFAHYVVITGYGDGYWLVQDPYGQMDLLKGEWIDRSADAGRNIRYKSEYMNQRLFVAGGATGWCWVNFRKL